MELRPYQQGAVDATIDWLKKGYHGEACLIEAATGAGKSYIIAELASYINKASNGRRVLCLAPSAELVEQNREKYLLTGRPASVFSASAGAKCLSHPVVFGTPLTVLNSIDKFSDDFVTVILDEAHGITPTIVSLIDKMRESYPRLKVIGLSATPFRTKTGYIYAIGDNMVSNHAESCVDPYFLQKVYTIPAYKLIEQGFLTKPVIGDIFVPAYDTDGLELGSNNRFDPKDIDRVFVGKGRLTSKIVGDVINQSQDKKGVMFFAATIQHAEEIMNSLPGGMSQIITGKTKRVARKQILSAFKDMKFKYIVNVGVLTTGFDVPHVDVIAILRATESVSLLQQIIGRSLRVHESKDFSLILDYGNNIERHCEDDDIFAPVVLASESKSGGGKLEVECPDCGYQDEFSAVFNEEGYGYDKYGYFVDLEGKRVVDERYGAVPGHHGRRCHNHIEVEGVFTRCQYRWTSKDCPDCDEPNDITARYCCSCKSELIDPNEKLEREFRLAKRDPNLVQTDKVLSSKILPTISKAGNDCLKVMFVTQYRTVTVWFMPQSTNVRQRKEHHLFMTQHNIETITYQRDRATGFYRIYGYNGEEDKCERV